MRRLLFACCLLVASPAFALTIPSLPDGMCLLDPDKPAESVVIDTIRQANQGSNELLSGFARCSELQALRGGKMQSISHYGVILQQQLPEAIALSRAEYLQAASQVYALNSELVGGAIAQAQGASESAMRDNMLSGAGTLQAKSAGVIYNGPDVLVIGMNQSHQVSGKTIAVASTAGVTLIGGKTVSVNLYAPASEGHGPSKTTLVQYVPELIKANE